MLLLLYHSFMKDLLILGIETSCDETAAAVVKNGTDVLSNVVSSQIDIHALYGGVVPEIASRNHILNIDKVVSKALADASVTLSQIDAIAVTYGAGLVGALFVGVSYAKGLAQASKIPLVGVSHIEGHIASNLLNNKNLKPPFVTILASGGHTSVVLVKSYNQFEVFASTVDDAIGEAFDKVARVLGLPYPGGVAIDKLSQSGSDTFKFKSVLLKNNSFSYSGLKTAVINVVYNANQKGEEINKNDLAKSFTVSAIDGLVQCAVEVCKMTKVNKLAIAGGVAANSYLRQCVKELEKQNIEVFLPELQFCGDNGAMIASRGYFSFLNNDFADLTLTADPTIRLRGTVK